MPGPLLLLAAFATGIAALSCSREEKNQTPPQKGPVSPQPSSKMSLPCSSPVDTISRGQKTWDFCHEDKNQDDLIQLGEEPFSIRDQQDIYRFTEPEALQKFSDKQGFPQFQGLNFSHWLQARKDAQQLKFQKITLEDEKSFSAVIDYLQKNKIDLQAANDLVKKIKPMGVIRHLNFKERTYGLLIAGILLELKKDSMSVFYQKNQEMIDTIYQNILDEKFHLVAEGGDDFSILHAIFYDYSQNGIRIPKPPPQLTSEATVGAFFHELVHFYQDIKKSADSILEKEKEAHLLQSEYLIYRMRLDKGSGSEEQINSLLGKLSDHPSYSGSKYTLHALRAKYFEIHGQEKKAVKSLKAFDEGNFKERGQAVFNSQILATTKKYPVIQANIQKLLQANLQGGAAREWAIKHIEKEISVMKGQRDEIWEQLKKPEEMEGEDLNQAVTAFFFKWALIYLYEKLHFQITNPQNLDTEALRKEMAVLEKKLQEEVEKQHDALSPAIYAHYGVMDGV